MINIINRSLAILDDRGYTLLKVTTNNTGCVPCYLVRSKKDTQVRDKTSAVINVDDPITIVDDPRAVGLLIYSAYHFTETKHPEI